ncbi:MAG: DNA alkylation repair protein, partial [Sphingopyxis sp.]|nr:DNA alkylation repair protein [Sphingopyxis sp.]
TVRSFAVDPAIVRLGERIVITAEIVSDSTENQPLVVDYRVHYARAGGKSAAKVFKWKTFDLAGGEAVALRINQTIRDFSTRRHHPGRHSIDLIVNGQTMATGGFDLLAD